MLHDDRDAVYRLEGKCWPQTLLLLMALSLMFAPLACTSSTADSKEEEAPAGETESESDEEETSYDIPAYTGDRSVEQRIRDASLATQIRQALVRQDALRVFDFEPTVDGETVTLQGDVNTRSQWTEAGRVAERLARDRTVDNAVTIGGRPADTVTEESDDGDAADREDGSNEVYHTVQAGESLWQIAERYGASVQRLRSLNDLTSDALSVGQRLRVR